MKVLVTGGARSGKSAHAEGLLSAQPQATYVATGAPPDDTDPDWAARVATHQARRPEQWTTLETLDLALAVTGPSGSSRAVLVDSLGTWLTAVIDEQHAWDSGRARIEALVLGRLDGFVTALRDTVGEVVVVTEEVGLGVVPEHPSGRVFRDLLGAVNQRVAAVCDEVHLVVAGRVLRL